jgi:hypothetical protein
MISASSARAVPRGFARRTIRAADDTSELDALLALTEYSFPLELAARFRVPS